MNTYLGRVVYDRAKNRFSEKDVARIIASISPSGVVADVSKTFGRIAVEYLIKEDFSLTMKIGFIISMLVPIATYLEILVDELIDQVATGHAILTEEWYV